jgi:photosystem II stability/assembly factor-like uncharacterized protein
MINLRLMLIALLASLQLFSQEQLKPELLEQMKFRNIGPAGMSGRIAAIDVDPANDQRIYAGAASGGLWRSDNGGISWACIFNNEKAASVGAVKVDPSNSSIIWVGTGEGNPRNSQTSGRGIFKSLDGGQTWQFMGLAETKNIHRIAVDPRNSNVVYVAAQGVAWGENPERGIYKTTDGGQTWTKILYVDEKTGAADLVMDPKNPNKLIAAMWQYRRWPWYFNSGGQGSGIYVTYDGGQTWKKRTDKDGLPEGDLGRIGVAISPSNTDVVYALVENKAKNALYKSTDGGTKWHYVSDDENIGNRPFYYSEIFVSPDNPNRIYSLWTVLTMSEDGGKTWQTIAPYNDVHPDHHAFWVGKNPDYLIEGNDGGLNISRDGGKTWRFVENLPLAQFYHIRLDNQMPYNVYGGMQDNGSWRGPAYQFTSGGIRNANWQELFFGDGFDVVPDPENPRFVYAQSQEGNVARVDVETGYAKLIKPVHPDAIPLRFNWNAGIAQDPFDAGTIYFGSQFLHKSTNRGDSWQIISPDLTTNDTAHQKALISGGLTYDVTGAENYTTIITIVPSPLEKDVLWVGTDDGNIQLTRDGGKTWNKLVPKGIPAGAWVPHIHVSNINKGEAFIVVNDYRRNNWKPYLLHTTDYGKTFTSLVDETNVEGYAMSVVQDTEAENLLFLGTEIGLYFSLDKGASWTKWGSDFPTVQVADMAIHPREADLVVGTFGRAAWVLDDIRPLRKLAMEKEKITKNPLTCFATPDAYQAVWIEASGTRFAASGIFAGENRSSDARLSFWITKNEKDTAFSRVNKLKVTIYDQKNVQIRTWKTTFNDGLNRITWDLCEKGNRWPSMQEPRANWEESDPSGVTVLPGIYKVVIAYGKAKDSTMVTVLADPRLQIPIADLEANQAYKRGLQKQVAAITKVADQLREAKKGIDLIERQLADKKGDEWKTAREKVKAVKDSLESVRLAIFGKEDVKGYFEQPETWMHILGQTGWVAMSNLGAIGENNQILAVQFEKKTAETLAKANTFFIRDWPAFTAYFQENPISLFNQVEPVKID